MITTGRVREDEPVPRNSLTRPVMISWGCDSLNQKTQAKDGFSQIVETHGGLNYLSDRPEHRWRDSMSQYMRSGSLLSAAESRLLIVDVQEKLAPVVLHHERMVKHCSMLVRAANVTGVPVVATEQYPKGLGQTVDTLRELIPDRKSKVRFSSAEVLEWDAQNPSTPNQVVVAGIETHVCIQQTCLDLLAAGFAVFVVADAVSARKANDHDYGLQRMRDSGVTIITTEVAMFEWCEVAGTDQFKQISRMIIENPNE